MEHETLTGTIIRCAMTVHSALGPGFLESVYQNALATELRQSAVKVDRGRPIRVRYRGTVVGEFFADLLAEDTVLLELEAVRELAPAHEVQLVNYLTATGYDIGLLLNFGAESLQFRRKSRIYRR